MEKIKNWAKKHPILTTILGLIVLGIIASPFLSKDNNNSLNNSENNLKIGYLSLVEDDGTCNDKGPVPLFYSPDSFNTNYVLPESDDFCTGGVRVLIEKEQGDWVKIIVSDNRYSGTQYGWVLKPLVHMAQS